MPTTNKEVVLPLGFNNLNPISLDEFIANRPGPAWMYFIFLRTTKGRLLRNLSNRRYYVREDGFIAAFDPEESAKAGWDFYDPKQGFWASNRDLKEPEKVWGQGSAGIYLKRGRKPGTKMPKKDNPGHQAAPAPEPVAEAQPAKRKRGRPRKHPLPQQAEAQASA